MTEKDAADVLYDDWTVPVIAHTFSFMNFQKGGVSKFLKLINIEFILINHKKNLCRRHLDVVDLFTINVQITGENYMKQKKNL